jgi:hypothetical protein
MITKTNYFDHVNRIGFKNLPETLKQAHVVLMTKTDMGKNWNPCEKDDELKKVKDLAFEKLGELIKKRSEGLSGTKDSPAVKRAKQDAKGYHKLRLDQLKMILRLEKDAELEDGLTDEIIIRKEALQKAISEKEGLKGVKRKRENPFKEINAEVAFIRRFLEFHDQVIWRRTFEIFIDELQEAIRKKKIRKTSPVAKDILAMQKAAIAAFNSMKSARHFVLKPDTIKHLKKIIEKHEDAFFEEEDKSTLKSKRKPLALDGVVIEPEVEAKPEIKEEPKPEPTPEPIPETKIMSSVDFAKEKFSTIGFKDKWLELIGDPAPGFTIMVFGKPKMGKSYLCIDLAGYLARNHGKVLYVAKEEKLDATLQKKLMDKDVANPNLFVSDFLPEDLSGYDFIFLDSVNKLELSPQDLTTLKSKNPGKSFIFVFQTTKEGKFRGANTFQHDVDVVIEIPEQGKAVQFGRFNQGGKMDIFRDRVETNIEESAIENKSTNPSQKSLEGISKKKTKKVGKSKRKDWTKPKHLDPYDHSRLKRIQDLCDKGDYDEAMEVASHVDTIVREEIPPDYWLKMGGRLTTTGEAKLKKLKKQGFAGNG